MSGSATGDPVGMGARLVLFAEIRFWLSFRFRTAVALSDGWPSRAAF
ncbi:hypothetical protein EDD90_3768 [Streptomyces sp. Ag109_O5-1]|nr:hypothetical protein EDD90_3768 [Streptomyces sp. Ag109_O5-1]